MIENSERTPQKIDEEKIENIRENNVVQNHQQSINQTPYGASYYNTQFANGKNNIQQIGIAQQPYVYNPAYVLPQYYNGTQPNYVVVNQFVPKNNNFLYFDRDPTRGVCPFCSTKVTTRVEKSFNCLTCIYYTCCCIFLGILIFFAGANGDCSGSDCNCSCSKSERCCRCCMNAYHYCPNCKRQIGKFDSCHEKCRECSSCHC